MEAKRIGVTRERKHFESFKVALNLADRLLLAVDRFFKETILAEGVDLRWIILWCNRRKYRRSASQLY